MQAVMSTIGMVLNLQAQLKNKKMENSQLSKQRTRNFSVKEDNLLVSAWLEITQDAVVGTDQLHRTYWKRIHDHFHAHKDFETDRNPSSLSHRWCIIQESVNRFCGWYVQIQNRNRSGVTELDKIEEAKVL